jgi:hypothetical protein
LEASRSSARRLRRRHAAQNAGPRLLLARIGHGLRIHQAAACEVKGAKPVHAPFCVIPHQCSLPPAQHPDVWLSGIHGAALLVMKRIVSLGSSTMYLASAHERAGELVSRPALELKGGLPRKRLWSTSNLYGKRSPVPLVQESLSMCTAAGACGCEKLHAWMWVVGCCAEGCLGC